MGLAPNQKGAYSALRERLACCLRCCQMLGDGAHFQFVKFPGHQGVGVRHGGCRCRRQGLPDHGACPNRPHRAQHLCHSPCHPSQHKDSWRRADADEGEQWSHWAGTPSAHAYSTKPISFFRARGQEVVTRRLLLNYEAEQPEGLVVIDRVHRLGSTRRCAAR